MKLILLVLLSLVPCLSLADDQPMIEVGYPGGRTAVVLMPDALRTAMERSSYRVGDSNWVSLSLHAGAFTGLRASYYAYSSDHLRVVAEGFYGAGITAAGGLGEVAGAGLRVEFEVVSDGKNDALLISPGLDVIIAFADPAWHQNSGWVNLRFGPYTDVYLLATDVDVAWLHQFAPHFSYQLGLKIGGVVGLGGTGQDREPSAGEVSPMVSLFTGFRF